MTKQLVSQGLEDLQNIAKTILKEFPEERIFAFYGKMGVGKTTLIKKICIELGVCEITYSPSYALINEYLSPEKGTIFHFDFYRINNQEEVLDIGYEEYFFSGNYCLLEWPEKIADLLPESYILVSIDENEENHIRTITFGKNEIFQ